MNTVSVAPAEAVQPAAQSDLFDDVWRLFASPRLALFLMLGIAAACLAGAVLVQAPGESVFASVWFRGLLGLLAVNIVVCTINRLPGIWQAVFRPVPRPADGLFERGQPRETVLIGSRSPDAALPRLRGALTRLHVVETREADGVYLYIDQNRFARFGTLISHAAMVLILAAAVLSGPMGYFEEPGFAVPIGSTREVGHNTSLSLRVDDFVDEYYPEDGMPKDYRSDLVLYDAGREVARQTVRVNEPLVYNGVRFHQSAYGNAAALTIRDANGRTLFQDSIPLTLRASDGQRPVGYVDLPGRDLRLYVVGTAGTSDPLIQPGQMAVEAYQGSARTPTYSATLTQRQTQSVGPLQVMFERELQFTSLRVVRDPSAGLIWLASALIILGFALAFYFPHRRLWARVRSVEAGVEVTLVGAGKDMAQPLARIAERVRRTGGR